MYTTCTLRVHYMYTTCTLPVAYMYATCTLHVRYMYTCCVEQSTVCGRTRRAEHNLSFGDHSLLKLSPLLASQLVGSTQTAAVRFTAGLADRRAHAFETTQLSLNGYDLVVLPNDPSVASRTRDICYLDIPIHY